MSYHVTKKLFLQISFLCMFTTTINSNLSDQAKQSTYQNPWNYLEYIFVIKPERELSLLTEHAFATVGILGGLAVAKEYFYQPTTSQNKTITKDSSTNYDPIKSIYIAGSGIMAAKAGYGLFNCVAKRYIHKKTLAEFLQKWDIHRMHLPTSFIECFDEIATLYKTQGDTLLTNMFVAEVFELIQHHIEHHFENRYKKPETKNSDPIETFKNCTEIWTNFKK